MSPLVKRRCNDSVSVSICLMRPAPFPTERRRGQPPKPAQSVSFLHLPPRISLAPFFASPFSWFLTFWKVKGGGPKTMQIVMCGKTHKTGAPKGQISQLSPWVCFGRHRQRFHFHKKQSQAHNNIVVGAKLTPNRRSWPTNLPGWRAPCLTTSHGDSFGSDTSKMVRYCASQSPAKNQYCGEIFVKLPSSPTRWHAVGSSKAQTVTQCAQSTRASRLFGLAWVPCCTTSCGRCTPTSPPPLRPLHRIHP